LENAPSKTEAARLAVALLDQLGTTVLNVARWPSGIYHPGALHSVGWRVLGPILGDYILRLALILQARFRIAAGNDRPCRRGFTAWAYIQLWNAIGCGAAKSCA
jgi:hypothetical protein